MEKPRSFRINVECSWVRVTSVTLVALVWYSMVWYWMVFHGLVWYNMVWNGMVWFVCLVECVACYSEWLRVRMTLVTLVALAWYSMVWYWMVFYGLVWYSMVWNCMVWFVCLVECVACYSEWLRVRMTRVTHCWLPLPPSYHLGHAPPPYLVKRS